MLGPATAQESFVVRSLRLSSGAYLAGLTGVGQIVRRRSGWL